MKIIVSSEHFPKVIQTALSNNYTDFVIDGKNKTIEFYKGAKYYRDKVFPALDYGNTFFKAKFNQLQWYKMAEFIKQLEEQPIVIEFDYGDEPFFTITQFTKRF